MTEPCYWLRLMTEAKLIPPAALRELVDETEQLTKILSSILLSSKYGKKESRVNPDSFPPSILYS